MKETILIFVHTEYHLLLAVNQILGTYNDKNRFDIVLIISKRNQKRLTLELDFSWLPVKQYYFSEDINISENLSREARKAIEELFVIKPDVFIFFQEMDPLMVILANYYSKEGTEIFLYQDGLKPYVNLKYHSLGLIWHEFQQNLWFYRNGFPVESWLSPIWSKKYGRLGSIDSLFLTFPESYYNWNRKAIKKIEPIPLTLLNNTLKRIFNWNEEIITERNGVILYMSQPMHDDGSAERRFLNLLTDKFPERKVYIKLHPLTNEVKTNQYRNITGAVIIKSQIPAELFIMNLHRSMILSVNSTSMFLDNPENTFFYLYRFYRKDIRRLSRYEMKSNPAPHIKVVDSLDELYF